MLIGVLGGGQLGRMLALAGIPLGLRFRFFDPAPECPAAAVGEHVRAEWDDHGALEAFAKGLDAATFEFENVPAATLAFVGSRVAVRPGPLALEKGQDRLNEKAFFESCGLNVHPYRAASSEAELERALREIGLPCVAKTRRMGYDGKGQAVIRDLAEVPAAWRSLGGHPLLVERFIAFESEASIIGVRGADGDIRTYPLTANVHRGGILRVSSAPAAGLDPSLERAASEHVRAVLAALDHVGVLAIEFFVSQGRLLANEFAPRVHNSGHWTIEGACTSQFENHVRAVAGLPLGDASLRAGPCVMVNIIGERPDATSLLSVPGLHLHDYGKAARPGRKIGHATLLPPPQGWEQDPALARLMA